MFFYITEITCFKLMLHLFDRQPILVLNLLMINQSSAVPVKQRKIHMINFVSFKKNQKLISTNKKQKKLTCSNNVRCESPLSASGSGNFSDGT